MKKSTKIALGVVAVLLIALVALGVSRRGQNQGTEVETGKVARKTLVSLVSANGTIDAKRKVDISANVMGQIDNLAVREGDQVAEGDFLMQIDRTKLAADAAGAEASLLALRSDLDASRATAREAELSFRRAQSSFESGVIPRAELDRAQANLDSARANVSSIERRIQQARAGVESARDTLSKTTIRAPIAGVVTALPVEEGEVAVIGTMNNPGTILMTISDLSVVEAVMEVDETDIPNVTVGQMAEVSIDAYGEQKFAGRVTEVASSPMTSLSATDAVNFEVKIQLDNPPPGVRPGFSASATIETGRAENAIAIPIQALVIREAPAAEGAPPTPGAPAREEEGVYVVDEATSTASFRNVSTGLAGDTDIQITQGLKEGEVIIIGPFRALRELEDGAKIRVAKPDAEDGGEREGGGE